MNSTTFLIPTDWNSYLGTSFFPAVVFLGYKKFFPYLKETWPKDAKILELGSGTGRLSFWLSQQLPVKEAVLVDLNEKLLDKSRKIFSTTNTKVRFVKADVLNLDLGEKFYLVHSAGLLEHFSPEEQISILRTYRRHTQEGGSAICYVPIVSRSYRFWRRFQEVIGTWRFTDETPILPEELIGLFQEQDFKVVAKNRVWSWYLMEMGILARF